MFDGEALKVTRSCAHRFHSKVATHLPRRMGETQKDVKLVENKLFSTNVDCSRDSHSVNLWQTGSPTASRDIVPADGYARKRNEERAPLARFALNPNLASVCARHLACDSQT